MTIKQRLPYNEPNVEEKGELSMPRPEQKHLKRYGIVDLRPLKVNSRLGFKYFTGKHPSSKKQVFVKTDPTSGQAAAREGAVLKILNAQTHRAHFPRLVVHEPHGHFAFIATEFIPGDTLNTFGPTSFLTCVPLSSPQSTGPDPKNPTAKQHYSPGYSSTKPDGPPKNG